MVVSVFYSVGNTVKMRKYWSPTFSPFPILFSKVFFFTVVKVENCVTGKDIIRIVSKNADKSKFVLIGKGISLHRITELWNRPIS